MIHFVKYIESIVLFVLMDLESTLVYSLVIVSQFFLFFYTKTPQLLTERYLVTVISEKCSFLFYDSYSFFLDVLGSLV